MATTVGVRDLKNALSRWLRLVQSGGSVVVLDRGVPVAILSPVPTKGAARTVADHLASLAARGLLRLGSNRRHRVPRRSPRVNLSDAVLEDRGDRA